MVKLCCISAPTVVETNVPTVLASSYTLQPPLLTLGSALPCPSHFQNYSPEVYVEPPLRKVISRPGVHRPKFLVICIENSLSYNPRACAPSLVIAVKYMNETKQPPYTSSWIGISHDSFQCKRRQRCTQPPRRQVPRRFIHQRQARSRQAGASCGVSTCMCHFPPPPRVLK